MVTGATGLLGSFAVRALLAVEARWHLGLRVVAVSRDKRKAEALLGTDSAHLQHFYHDFGQPVADWQQWPCECDGLLHLAAPTASQFFVTHPVETIRTVVHGTETALGYAQRTHAPMVEVSTLEVYGVVEDDAEPICEAVQGYIDPTAVRSSYPMAKRMAECLSAAHAAEYGTRVRVARLAQTFGAGVDTEDGRVFAHFARSVLAERDITLQTDGSLSRCYCSLPDAVSALLFILLKGEDGQVYNVANEHTYCSVREMAEEVCQRFAPHCSVKVQSGGGSGIFSPTTRLRLSSERLRALGWRPQHDLATMFSRLLSHFRDCGL